MRFALAALAFCLVCPAATYAQMPTSATHSVWLEEMTWPEIKEAIKAGTTTAIIPTGGTEQNGPHIILGKHNFILQYTAMETAKRLGNALVAPIMEYVPEGDIHPPTGHMRFAGTLSLKPETFAAVLEDTARSLKEHGFKIVCFLGEHGASQPVQKAVADKLNAEWKEEGVRVLHIGDYYDEHNGQVEWMRQNSVKELDIQAHGGLADTAEMMAARPQGVRLDLRGSHTQADYAATGAAGSSLAATREIGAKLIELKVQAAVKQIQSKTAKK